MSKRTSYYYYVVCFVLFAAILILFYLTYIWKMRQEGAATKSNLMNCDCLKKQIGKFDSNSSGKV